MELGPISPFRQGVRKAANQKPLKEHPPPPRNTTIGKKTRRSTNIPLGSHPTDCRHRRKLLRLKAREGLSPLSTSTPILK